MEMSEILNWEYWLPMVADWAIKAAVSVVVLVGGWIAVKLIVNMFCKVLARRGADEMLRRFAGSVLKAVLLIVVAIMTLSTLGVDTTSLIAVLGAGSLAIGLALQDSIKNVASGVMVIVTRPFKVGDLVEIAGISGQVEKVDLTQTLLRTLDNRSIIVPNGTVFSSEIINYSARKTRRIDLVFGIGYGDDIATARAIIQGVLDADDRVLDNPAPTIAVSELADSSVNFVVWPWVATGDYWNVRFDVIERVKLAFDKRGVSIPFPQMDLHLEKTA